MAARAEQAGRRLHRRWAYLEGRRWLRPTVVATAVARKLAGWCWRLAVTPELARDLGCSEQTLQLGRPGDAVWTERKFDWLLRHLQNLGYGRLHPEGVPARLALMTRRQP